MRYLLLTGLLLTYIFLQGQAYTGSDSLYISYRQQQRLDFLFRNASLMADSLRQNFGVANLSYGYNKRNFRTSQVAHSARSARFNTQGIRYLGRRTMVSGSFNYEKIWEDSLSHYLAGLEANSMPTYYFVEKAGKFERQTYRANAHVGHWLSDHWKLDASLDYTHHWATRSVDPRMDLYSMTWLFKPAISYAVGRSIFSLQPVYGRGTGQTTISYKSRTIGAGDQNQAYHHISSYGYGTIQTLDSADLRQYDRYVGLALKGKSEGNALTIHWDVGYLRRNNESTHDIQNLNDYHVAQSFQLQSTHFDLLFIQRRRNGASLGLQYRQRDGVDGHRFRGQNYFLSQWEAGFTFLQNLGQQSSWPVELGLSVQTAYDERDDAASSHYAQRQWADFAVPMSLSHTWNVHESLRWQIEPALRIPLRNTLQIPSTQINSFSTGIAYPEFYYYAVKAISLQSKIAFLTRSWWDKAPIGLFLEGRVSKPFQYQGDFFPGTTIYTGINFWSRVGLQFYL